MRPARSWALRETWTQWRAILEEKGRANEIKHEAADRSFGAGDVKKSRHAVSFPTDLQGNEIIVKVYLVDGNVPFLAARPLLERSGASSATAATGSSLSWPTANGARYCRTTRAT